MEGCGQAAVSVHGFILLIHVQKHEMININAGVHSTVVMCPPELVQDR